MNPFIVIACIIALAACFYLVSAGVSNYRRRNPKTVRASSLRRDCISRLIPETPAGDPPYQCPECGDLTVYPNIIRQSYHLNFLNIQFDPVFITIPILMCSACGAYIYTHESDERVKRIKRRLDQMHREFQDIKVK